MNNLKNFRVLFFENFQNNEIDIIISDLKVKDGLALSFIEQIRSINKEIPIVVLSAHKDEEFLLKAIPLGLTSYEIKPINFSDFKNEGEYYTTHEKC